MTPSSFRLRDVAYIWFPKPTRSDGEAGEGLGRPGRNPRKFWATGRCPVEGGAQAANWMACAAPGHQPLACVKMQNQRRNITRSTDQPPPP